MSSKSNSDNEAQSSSNMDSENQEKLSAEESLKNIIQFVKEYTAESVDNLKRHKFKLLSVLKTHRPLKIGNYHYGLSEKLKKNGRLIVFEWDDKTMVRVYSQLNKYKMRWECRACERLYKRKIQQSSSVLFFICGIVFVPSDHNCPPRDYNLLMQYQKYLEEGNVTLARRMTHTVSFECGQDIYKNIVNVIDNASLSMISAAIERTNDNGIMPKSSAKLKRKSNDNQCASSSAEFITKTSNFEKAMCKKIIASDKPVASNIQKSSESTVQKNETLPIPKANTFPFKIPSTFALKEICAKLGIKYCKEANEFWKEIKFTRIDPSSTNIQTQKFKTKNLYKILSNFFTGKFSDYEQIYFLINSEFRDKLVLDGKLLVDEINELISSYTVTKKHLKFFAEFIPCRIMIFNRDNNDEVKKYGNWKNMGSNILTLVLSFSNRKYSVVLNL